MANKKIWLGMLVIVLAFGMMACGGNDGDTITVQTTSGKLTINNMPGQADGFYVYGNGASGSTFLLAASSINSSGNLTFGRVASGSVTLNVWMQGGTEDSPAANNYTGNHTANFTLYFFESTSSVNIFTVEGEPEDFADAVIDASITFVNGVATINYVP